MKRKFNIKIVGLAILSLVFLALMFFISWWFIVPLGIVWWINQRQMFGNS